MFSGFGSFFCFSLAPPCLAALIECPDEGSAASLNEQLHIPNVAEGRKLLLLELVNRNDQRSETPSVRADFDAGDFGGTHVEIRTPDRVMEFQSGTGAAHVDIGRSLTHPFFDDAVLISAPFAALFVDGVDGCDHSFRSPFTLAFSSFSSSS